jgi:E3 ubiquitin-protein ligase UBR2
LQALVGSQRIHSHKELLAWIIAKWCHLKGEAVTLPMADLDQSNACEQENSDAAAEKKRLAEMRRAKIMAQMQSAQKNFIKENAQLFDDTSSGLDQQQQPQDMEVDVTAATTSSVCLGPMRSQPVTAPTAFTCILCQEEENLLPEGQALVTAAFIQKSTVLNRLPRSASSGDDSPDGQQTSSPQYAAFPLLTADLACAPFTSSCGHIMHGACWQKYFDDLVANERQRNRQRYPHSFDTERQEFLCPLCRGLSNCVIPIIPQVSRFPHSSRAFLIAWESLAVPRHAAASTGPNSTEH